MNNQNNQQLSEINVSKKLENLDANINSEQANQPSSQEGSESANILDDDTNQIPIGNNEFLVTILFITTRIKAKIF